MRFLSLFLFLLIVQPTFCQKQTPFRIQLELNVTGDRTKAFQNQLESYLLNELAKIPDVKQVSSNPAFFLHVHVFQLPCSCDGLDFHYRVHFFRTNFEDADSIDPLPISEGFKSLDGLEALSRDIVAQLNVYSLKRLRQ